MMRGLTISSLASILALSSTVAVAAPRAAVSPVPRAKVAANVLKGALNIENSSCKTRGPCSSSSPPGTCCGTCILIDPENGYCHDNSASCKIRGACSAFSPPGTCCGTCILISPATGYCVPPGSSIR